MSNEFKFTKKIVYEISKNDEKLLQLVKVAAEIVLKEDEKLLKELAKH
jgi:hypothetical protein